MGNHRPEAAMSTHRCQGPALLALGGFLIAAGTGCSNSKTRDYDFTPSSSNFVRVDRMGQPAVATAVVPLVRRDAYNQANPSNDVLGEFVPDITARVDALHTALDDDLAGLGLTPSSTATAIAQAAPLVVPDVITIDPALPAGFPNGRRLQDQVIDLTLAVLLLDLGVHPVTTLANVPVNPPANEFPFQASFPFLAERQ